MLTFLFSYIYSSQQGLDIVPRVLVGIPQYYTVFRDRGTLIFSKRYVGIVESAFILDDKM